jgi:prepilin-type N-terminal cleavage/methylation domain-containing protein
MTRFHGGPRRAGFTVIELLVVIAVIAILAGLILSAVQNVRNSARKTQTVNDIQQMSSAIQNFKAKYRVDYIPSQIVLHENLASYGNTQIERDSIDYLTRIWPHIMSSAQGGTRFNWSGRQPFVAAQANQTFTLQGDQCLVFFLGGIPRDANVAAKVVQVPSGFSSNPSDPTSTSGVDRPFVEFDTSRLASIHAAPNNRFPSYLDSYSTGGSAQVPYVYFSSYGKPNGYNPYVTNAATGAGNDCQLVLGNFFAYKESAGRYYQPNGFQIVSAGKDRNFGAGLTNPNQGVTPPGTVGQPAQDNVVNFIGNGASTLGSSP